MSNYSSGHDAEVTAADYLANHGFKIVAMNWKTRYCEIDILATKRKTMHFVEVKSRSTAKQGMGLDYITNKKLQQMAFAAELWVAEHDWRGDYVLSAVSIDDGQITFVENLTY